MLSIAIDMDEVIADPTTKMMSWYERDYGIRFTPEQLMGKHLMEAADPLNSPVFYKYLNTPGFFRDLGIFPHAQEIVNAINKKYTLYIVSAALEFPNSLIDKYYWLKDHFPFITWQQICFCGDKSIVQTDIMIDDHALNFKNFNGRKYT